MFFLNNKSLDGEKLIYECLPIAFSLLTYHIYIHNWIPHMRQLVYHKTRLMCASDTFYNFKTV
jgi:hypothetical protein